MPEEDDGHPSSMPDSQFLSLVLLGFLLGLRHAIDADHVVAVLTIATENRTFWRSSLVGFCWGVGHTVILLVVGGAVLLFKLTIPSTWANLFEAGVGVMLVGLGLSVALTLWAERAHLHAHWHEHPPTPDARKKALQVGEQHRHLHSHRHGSHHDHLHRFRVEYKSLAVGMVHGLAGSAALLILVLAAASSFAMGVLYILIFGIGSILGMVLLATAMSIPFAMSAEKMTGVHRALKAAAALVSIVLGTRIIFELLIV
jgi:high-affinity nickel permease